MTYFSDRKHRWEEVLRAAALASQSRNEWQRRARHALDSWSARGIEESVAAAIEQGYRDGIKHAAKVVEEKGDPKVALELRRIADRR